MAPIFPPNWLENSVALIDTIFRITVIDTFSRMDGNCVASSVKLLYLGILYRFSVQENFCLAFSIASSVKKILANKIVSLYSIFFSKILYLYRFNQYIFEYRCPPLFSSQFSCTSQFTCSFILSLCPFPCTYFPSSPAPVFCHSVLSSPARTFPVHLLLSFVTLFPVLLLLSFVTLFSVLLLVPSQFTFSFLLSLCSQFSCSYSPSLLAPIFSHSVLSSPALTLPVHLLLSVVTLFSVLLHFFS